MYTTILTILGALVALFLVAIATRPPMFRIWRSLVIGVPPSEVFPHINDLSKASIWSPFMKMDPEIRINYEGPPNGVGASSSWTGKKIGEGRQTIVESRANELVRIKLEFVKPISAICTAEFLLEANGAGTLLTWSISGKNHFMARVMGVLGMHDRMIGGQFEKGLAELNGLALAGTRNSPGADQLVFSQRNSC